jgi:hypothetical protein
VSTCCIGLRSAWQPLSLPQSARVGRADAAQAGDIGQSLQGSVRTRSTTCGLPSGDKKNAIGNDWWRMRSVAWGKRNIHTNPDANVILFTQSCG